MKTWEKLSTIIRVPVVSSAVQGVFVSAPVFQNPTKTIEFPRHFSNHSLSIEKPLFEKYDIRFAIETARGWDIVAPFYDQIDLPKDGARVLCHFRKGDEIETVIGDFRVTPRSEAWLFTSDAGSDGRFLGPSNQLRNRDEFVISSIVIGQLSLRQV